MTEFGRSPLLTREKLEELGYAIALFPVSSLRAAMKAVEELFDQILDTGSQSATLNRMQTRAELYDLIEYDGYEDRDKRYFGPA